MSLKIRALSAAIAAGLMASATGAFAAIQDGNSAGTTGEVYLMVYDTNSANGWTYARDLGITAADLASITGTGVYGTGTGDVATATDGASLSTFSGSGGTNATWAGFLSKVGTDALIYGLYVDNLGASNGYATTVNTNTGTITTAAQAFTTWSTQNATQIGAGASAVSSFAIGTNNLVNGNANTFSDMGATNAYTVNGAAYHLGTGAADAADYQQLLAGLNGGPGGVGLSTTTAVGSSLSFFNAKAGSKGAAGTFVQYSGLFSLDSSGNLTYTVGTVPEPGTWAMLAAGLLTVGAIARRRAQG